MKQVQNRSPRSSSSAQASVDSSRRCSGSGKFSRLSPQNILLLKAALLDGEAALAAYREWRPTFDLPSIGYGEQRVLPLLHHNLTRLGIQDTLFDRFRGIRRYYWARNLKVMNGAREVFAALDRIGVPFIALKGVALVACYLRDRSLRPMDDVDILVPEERLEEAVALLAQMNLLPTLFTPSQLLSNYRLRSALPSWPFTGAGQNIDVHWKALHFNRRPGADDQFWQRAQKATVNGAPISVLNPADQLLTVLAHAAQSPGAPAGQYWPADAALIIRSSPDLRFECLVEEAQSRSLSAVMFQGLDLLADQFHLPIPRNFISQLNAATTWPERVETYFRAQEHGKSGRLFIALQDFRRGEPKGLSRSLTRTLPSFLKHATGAASFGSALLIAAQALAGRPAWLRRMLGYDRYRIIPDLNRLPKVGDALDLNGSEIEETAFITGWSHPEPTGRWTIGHEATIAWSVRGQPQDLILSVEGWAMLAQPDLRQRIDVWANDRCVAAWRFQAGETSPLPTSIILPRELVGHRGVLMVTLVVHRPSRPSDFGNSGDTRALGLHLDWLLLRQADSGRLFIPLQDFRGRESNGLGRRLTRTLPGFLKHVRGAAHIGSGLLIAAQAAAGRPAWLRRTLGHDRYRITPDLNRLPEVGDTLDLARRDIDEAAFIAGWAQPEPTGRWTVGHEATIAWSVRGQRQDLILSVGGWAMFSHPDLRQRVTVWANDRCVATWRFQAGETSPLPTSIILPLGLLRNRDVLMLTFAVHWPSRPSDFGNSADSRALGLHLRFIKLCSPHSRGP